MLQFVSGKDKILPEDNLLGTKTDILRKKKLLPDSAKIYFVLNLPKSQLTDFHWLPSITRFFLQNLRIHITPVFLSNDATIFLVNILKEVHWA